MGTFYEDNKVILIIGKNSFILPAVDLDEYAQLMYDALFCIDVIDNEDMLEVKKALASLNSAAFSKALTNMVPAQISGLPIVELENTNRIMALMQNRFMQLNKSVKKNQKASIPATVWIAPMTFWLRQHANQDAFPFKSNTTGVCLGLEKGVDAHMLFGLGVGYTASNVKWNDGLGNARMNEVYLAPYFAGEWRKLCYAGSIMGSYDNAQLNRNIAFNGLSRVATSPLNGLNLTSMIQLRREILLKANTYLLPEGSMTFAQLWRLATLEVGAGSLDMHYPMSFHSTMRTFFNMGYGIKGSRFSFDFDGRVNVGYLNTTMGNPNNVVANFIDTTQVCNDSIDVYGNLPSANQGVIGFSLLIDNEKSTKMELQSNYTFGGRSSVVELNFNLEFSF